MEALRVIGEVLATYRARKASGRITVDVRSGTATWVRPVVTDVKPPDNFPDEEQALRDFGETLREFQEKGVSGAVTLLVCEGRGVRVEKVVELEKVRVG